ncbi:MAG: malate dehydrogenase [Phycisphaerae bacterium]
MSNKHVSYEAAPTARVLGLASFAIGIAELAAPERLQSMLGLEPTEQRSGILRVLGVRELCHGLDILTQKQPAKGLWGRVLGDVLDTALFAAAAPQTKDPMSFAANGAALMAIGGADFACASKHTIM